MTDIFPSDRWISKHGENTNLDTESLVIFECRQSVLCFKEIAVFIFGRIDSSAWEGVK